MGGGTPRAATAAYTPRSPTPHIRLTRPLRHSCAGRNPRAPTPTPSPIHPSPLPGGRLGGGWNAPSRHCGLHAPIATPLPFSSFPRPLPSFLRRQEPTRPTPTPSPIHPSPLPGGRLGGGWNAASRHTIRIAPQSPMPHIRRIHPLRHIRSPPSFLRRQEPTAAGGAYLDSEHPPAAQQRRAPSAEVAWVPACAGMTVGRRNDGRGAGVTGGAIGV